ncbi:alpha/beta fold hydrolase [Marilutibacter chinensis]|uniref:Alpha/beta hydrolase n=1 Tax=Marilutibacter chinensis TaxID=2912247 RepID=A0ABS9HTA2_9GAMM|nr:alpha/beta hydrolase [Lysobacter chinensis]MCF7221756.1 alpha/beta hydrolase [Lysobacter chinensis]
MLRELVLDTPLGRIAGLRGGHPGAARVLALHGWLDNAASFAPIAPLLDGIELVAIDLPGHGRSAHLPPGADYSFPGAVNSVLDVADALGWDRFALLGHSMGAGIASLVAASCPERVGRLVAIEALGALADAPENTAARMRQAIAASRALRGKSLRVFPDLALAVRARMAAGTQVGSRLAEPAARLLVERGTVPVDGGFVWSSDPRLTLPTFQRPTEAQVNDLVAGIDCPTLTIFAEPAQPYLPDPLRRARAALLPDGRLVVMEGGHHLHMEDPATVAAAIGDFFLRQA